MTYPTWRKVKSSTQKCQKVGDMFFFPCEKAKLFNQNLSFSCFFHLLLAEWFKNKTHLFCYSACAGKPSAHQVEAHNEVERGPLFEQKRSRNCRLNGWTTWSYTFSHNHGSGKWMKIYQQFKGNSDWPIFHWTKFAGGRVSPRNVRKECHLNQTSITGVPAVRFRGVWTQLENHIQIMTFVMKNGVVKHQWPSNQN